MQIMFNISKRILQFFSLIFLLTALLVPSYAILASTGTKILTSNGYISTDLLEVGDRVVGYTGTQVLNTVEKKETIPNTTYYLINNTYSLAENQSIFVNDRVVHVFMLEVGDIIYDENHNPIVIDSIVKEKQTKDWTRLVISGDHSYIADGLLLHNASRYWVGGGSDATWAAVGNTNWGSASNTQNNSSVPTSADDVFFDGVGVGASDSTISADITILSLNMTGYANTLTQNASTNLTIYKSFTKAGTFTSSGNITFADTGATHDTTITCTGTLSGTVVITKDSGGDFIIAAGCSISLGASPTSAFSSDAATEFSNAGTVTISSGTWTITNSNTATIIITNSGTITHSGSGWDMSDDGSFTNTGTVTFAGTMSIERDFTQNGTFDMSGVTLTFPDNNATDDTTITCSGTLGGTIVITKDTGGDFIIAAGCSISLGASPTSVFSSDATTEFTNNGTVTISSGTWTITNSNTSGILITNAGTITHSGSGWDMSDDASFTNTGTVTFAGTMSIERNFTQSGTFDMSGVTLTFPDSVAADDTTITCSGTLGGTIVITKDTGGDFIIAAGCSISLGASPTSVFSSDATTEFTNNGTVTISSGTWTITNSNTSGILITNAGTITHSGSGWDMSDDASFTNTGTVTFAGTMSIERNFTQSGTFDMSGVTVTFSDTANTDDTTIACSGTLGGTVVVTKDADGDFIVDTGCSISLGASPTTTYDQDATNDFVNNGTITISSGTWTVTNFDSTVGTITNNGTITHSGSAWDMSDLTSFTNSATGTVTFSGTMDISNNFTQSGTFDMSGVTVTFSDTISAHDTTVTCTGTLGGTVVITKDADGDFIVASGCSISLGVDPVTYIDSSATNPFTNNGTVTITSGTWTVHNATVASTRVTLTNAGTITHSGTVWTLNDTNLTNTSTITFSSGTNLNLDSNFTQNGTFTPGASTNINFTDGSAVDDSTITCTGTISGIVVITKDNDGDFILSSGCTISLGANPTTTIDSNATTGFDNNGTITIASGTWTVVGTTGTALLNNDGTITHSGNAWDMGGTSAATINLTNAGTITYAGTTISLEGSLTQSGTFDLSGKTITFDDDAGQDDTTITCTGTLGGTIVITKDNAGDFIVASGCSVSLGADPTTTITGTATNDFDNNGTVVIPSGTWTIVKTGSTSGSINNDGTITHSGNGWNMADDIGFTNTGTVTYAGTLIQIERGLTQNGTFDLTGITVNFSSDDNEDDSTITCTGSLGGSVTFSKDVDGADVSVAGTCVISVTGTPDLSGLTISGGTFTAPAGNMNVSGNMTLTSGTFTHNSGTVVLDGTSQSIVGDFTFNNLTKTVAAADTLTFTAGDTQTIVGTLTLNGADGQLLSLASSTPASVWSIDPQGTESISYASVSDSTNINATAITCTDCTDGLGNTNWTFVSSTPAASSSSSGGGLPAVAFQSPSTPTGGFKISINNGKRVVNTRTITLNLNPTSDIKSIAIAEDPNFQTSLGQLPATKTVSYTLSPTEGEKTIYIRFFNIWGRSVDASTKVTYNKSATSTNNAYNFGTKLLRKGTRGDGVKELQRFLNDTMNMNLVLDGIFGPNTTKIMKDWQTAHGLKADGLVGPLTKKKMLETVSR